MSDRISEIRETLRVAVARDPDWTFLTEDVPHLLAECERLTGERDALASRLAAAEARIAEIRDGSQAYRYWRTNDDVLMYSCRFCPSPIEAVGRDGDHQHHRICALNPDYEAGMQAIRNERAALDSSREQATTEGA